MVYEAEDCAYCERFQADVLAHWSAPVAFVKTRSQQAPSGWALAKSLVATPTIVLFEHGHEVSRFTG